MSPSAEPVEPPSEPRSGPGILVALGASAGGLDSLCRFFDALPDDTRASYVVLMHLAPDRASNLVEILSDHSPLPVQSIADGDPVEAGRVSVPPPGTRATVSEETFTVEPRSTPTEHVIDILFASVANSWRDRGVGIVLSGSGSDGSRGVSELHVAGGLTLAEDPQKAEFGDMPRSAVETGYVDVVGIPEVLASEVGRLRSDEGLEPRKEPHDAGIHEILTLVRERRRRDFRGYKSNTIRRRISRRMRLCHCGSVEEYLDVLDRDPDELDDLLRDLLITVTRFFRDSKSFEKLKETAISDILDGKSSGDPVRVWVPGCASGEEAYTLAFLFLDEIRTRRLNVDLQIFATDLDESGLQTARMGVYPSGIEPDIPASLRERYLHAEDSTLRVKKSVRQRIIFSAHDVIEDPPFAHMDLVSCRNLLIYLEPEIQRRVLSYLHYALEPDGFLFLGASESILGSRNLFRPVSGTDKIFRKVPGIKPADFRFPTSFSGLDMEPEVEVASAPPGERVDLARLAQRALLERYGPPGALVDLEDDVVYYFGDTTPHLQSPPGIPDLDINHLVRSELSLPVRRVLSRVRKEDRVAASNPTTLTTGSEDRTVQVVAHPVSGGDDGTAFILVVFETLPDDRQLHLVAEASEDERSLVEQLEEELRRAQDELRETNEHKNAVNEELRSANEELISMNEELQSTNEELKTAKEELQSMNKELETVNAALNAKIEEAGRVNANMENLLASTRIAAVFLDTGLRIKGFTRAATNLFKLIPSDRGRPLMDVTHSVEVDDLEGPMRKVLETLEPYEETVYDGSGSAYSMRILPYRTEENVIDGVVITFVDISDLKRAESQAKRLVSVAQATEDAIVIVDTEGTIEFWNRAATDTYGYTSEEAVGLDMAQIVPEGDRAGFRGLLEEATKVGGGTELETRRVTRDGQILDVATTLTVIHENGDTKLAFTERDVTDRKASERHRELLLRELDHRVKNTLSTVEAIAERTIVNSGGSMDEFTETFRGRIRALGKTHKELSEQRWEGVDVESLVDQTLAPYDTDGRSSMEGEDFTVPVHATLPLAMALHELSTNAAKYGALSTPDGAVDVRWQIVSRDSGDVLELEWKQVGGPPVSPPETTGHGMTFLERGIAYEVDGSTDVRFEPDGVRCVIEIPLDESRNP